MSSSINTVRIQITNNSDSCSYPRPTTLVIPQSDRVNIDSERSTITVASGGSAGAEFVYNNFSGYFPRLTQGNNDLSVKVLGGSATIIVKWPVARWIT